MKFLPSNVKKKDVMLLNILYHKPSHENEWVDFLDVIYKDLRTGEVKLHTIEKPNMEVFFANEDVRNYTHNKPFIPVRDTYSKIFPFKSLEMSIAKEAGPNYVQMIKDYKQAKNGYGAKNIHRYRYVFGSDYDIENWYRIQWMLEYHNEERKVLTKAYLDIEVDGIDVEGFPKDGECPINAVTVISENTMSSHTFLLRNSKNPLIQEFEDDIDNFIKELHDMFDETYGKLKYNIYMYDEDREVELIRDLFNYINTTKPNFMHIWNGNDFDIPFIIGRIQKLGYEPKDIMCHKDFKIKQLYLYKDKMNYDIKSKGDYFKISAYTVYTDQMMNYVGVRKGMGELESHALNAVGMKEIGDVKIDYAEEANIKTLPYVNYKTFVIYGIKD